MTIHVASRLLPAADPVPFSRPEGEVIRSAAALAAVDAAERLLNSLHLAWPDVEWMDGVFTVEECLEKASHTVEELLDFCLLAERDVYSVLQEGARAGDDYGYALSAAKHMADVASILRRLA